MCRSSVVSSQLRHGFDRCTDPVLCTPQMNSKNSVFNIVCWNVRGLWRAGQMLLSSRRSYFCQRQHHRFSRNETSAHRRPQGQNLPSPCFSDFACTDANGSRGGIITAWNPRLFLLVDYSEQQFSLTTTLSSTLTDLVFAVTNVYGPADHADSTAFLDSLLELQSHITGA